MFHNKNTIGEESNGKPSHEIHLPGKSRSREVPGSCYTRQCRRSISHTSKNCGEKGLGTMHLNAAAHKVLPKTQFGLGPKSSLLYKLCLVAN